jgi:hypothetical protein
MPKVTKVLAEISYGNLENLLFALTDAACRYNGIPEDDWLELSLSQFLDYLHAMPNEQVVQLTETRFEKEVV